MKKALFPLDIYLPLVDETEGVYDTISNAVTGIKGAVTSKSSLYTSLLGTTQTSELTNVLDLIVSSIVYQYEVDQIAYKEKAQFERRIGIDIATHIPYFIKKWEVYKELISLTMDKMREMSSQISSSGEKGTNGSNVIQKSASTPTGVNPTPDTPLQEVNITEDEGDVSMETPTNDYVEKYTNFEGKTSGLHTSKISREGNINRQGSYKDILDLLDKLPKTIHDEITSLVSKHFIMCY